MKHKLSKYEIQLSMQMLENQIASGNHEAVDHALKMVNDLLSDPRTADRMRETFANEMTVLEIQRDSREYLMMWRTFMNIVHTIEARIEMMKDLENDA